MCPYDPENDRTKERGADVKDGSGTSITSAGNRLDVNAIIVPGPGGLSDYFSAEIDETGAPLAPIPIPPLTLALVFTDFATAVPFTSTGVIIENLNPSGGFPIWVSFAAGIPGSFHRIGAARAVSFDAKGAAGVVILDGNPAGGTPYNLHAWG